MSTSAGGESRSPGGGRACGQQEARARHRSALRTASSRRPAACFGACSCQVSALATAACEYFRTVFSANMMFLLWQRQALVADSPQCHHRNFTSKATSVAVMHMMTQHLICKFIWLHEPQQVGVGHAGQNQGLRSPRRHQSSPQANAACRHWQLPWRLTL